MTVQGELQRAMAIAEAAKGNYLLFAAQTEDQKAQQIYTEMAEDMDRHAQILQSRMDFLEQKYGGGESGKDQQDKKQKQGGGEKQQQDKGGKEAGAAGKEEKI